MVCFTMLSRTGSLPSDPAQLKRMVLALQAENADLRVYADLLRLMIFGAKSEKMVALDPAQIALDLGDLSDIATTGPVAADDDAPDPNSLSYPERGSWGIREPLPATPFMAGSGGGWIASSWVVMDRSRV